MRRAAPLALVALALAGCQSDQTVTGHGGAGSWQLTMMAGSAPPAPMLVTLHEGGDVRITGPCNTMSARQSAPYPWFHLENAQQTERGCADLAKEEVLFDALGAASLVEVAGDVLIITTSEGVELVFEARKGGAGRSS